MYRRFFAALLSLCLTVVLFPIPAARADTPQYTFNLYARYTSWPDMQIADYRWGTRYQYKAGETVTVTAPPSEGYQFREWMDLSEVTIVEGGKNTAVIKFVMPEKDVSLEALFNAPTPGHTILMINSATREKLPSHYAIGHPIAYIAGTVDGYAFKEWELPDGLILTSGDKTSERITFTVPDWDVTLTTVYEEIPNPFTDVNEDNYFYYSVLWAVNKDITTGTSPTTFSPYNTCTTANIITFLWRANGSPEPAGANPFRDVSVGSYYEKAALWASEKGLVSGETFNGGSPCTRAAVMKYLWILAGKPSAGAGSFTDVPSNADYAQAVSWAVQRGVTNGKTETTFAPSETCTRGQIVTFLYRNYK